MLNWKIHPKWYLLGALILPVVAIITLVLKSFYNDVEYNSFFNMSTTTFRAYIAFLVWSFIGEVVWVSYCIRELSKITKPFYAGLIVAVFWGTWFVPVIILGEGIFPEIPIIPAYIFRFGAAGICAFIYSRTKSAIPVLMLQYAANLTLVSFPITPTKGGDTTYTVFGTIYFLAMLAIWGLDYLIKKNKNKGYVQSELIS
jgi:membrane protease YdiL (CAAX protease family)